MGWGKEAGDLTAQLLERWGSWRGKKNAEAEALSDPYWINVSSEFCNSSISELVRAAVCTNQKDLAQFSFLLAEKHRDLKDEINRNPHDTDEIYACFTQLLEFAADGTALAAQTNIGFLLDYFKTVCGARATKLLPRICLKTNARFDGDESDPAVVVIRRDRKVGYDNDDHRVSENSGFAHVSAHGYEFLQNNLPELAGYTNPRLDISKVRLYLEHRLAKVGDPDEPDHLWMDCWEGSGKGNSHDQRNCYKSTLIVPLTLRNQELNREYLKKFNLGGVGRSIFGYLCFDHARTGYFQDEDVNLGYVFADILSLYWLTYITYTHASKTFWTAIDLLSKDPNYVGDEVISSLIDARQYFPLNNEP